MKGRERSVLSLYLFCKLRIIAKLNIHKTTTKSGMLDLGTWEVFVAAEQNLQQRLIALLTWPCAKHWGAIRNARSSEGSGVTTGMSTKGTVGFLLWRRQSGSGEHTIKKAAGPEVFPESVKVLTR